jgi:hypothetical protein
MRKSDNNSWVPTAKQAQYLSLPLSIKEGFYAGAVGAGKSDVLLTYPIIHRWHENPRFKGVYFRRTYKELENEIIPRSRRFYSQLGAKYNKSDKVWEFPNKNHSKSPMGGGSIIRFAHCENELDVHKYDSMEMNYVAFDELSGFTEWQYLYIALERVRRTIDSDLPAIIRSASNPGNIGHTWVKKRFIDPAPDGGVIIQNARGLKRVFIRATIKDNPYIDPEYLTSLESLPLAERKAKLDGDWNAFEGQVFDEFRERSYPDEPSNALHVVEPFEIPSYWPRIVGMDWGYAPPAMTWVGFGAISPDRRLYLYRELAYQKTKIEEWCADIKPYFDSEQPRSIKLCKSAGQDRGQEHTILQQVSSALGHNVELTSNQPGSRVAGKQLLHEYLRWKPKKVFSRTIGEFDQQQADWLIRNRGMKEYQSYLDSFKPVEEEKGLPKLQIFNTCPLFINAIKSCVYDKTNVEDVAEFPGDDPYDGGRYLVDAADRFFDTAKNEYDKLQVREQLTSNLAATGDMTTFYRQARALENKSKLKPIRRFHRAR